MIIRKLENVKPYEKTNIKGNMLEWEKGEDCDEFLKLLIISNSLPSKIFC